MKNKDKQIRELKEEKRIYVILFIPIVLFILFLVLIIFLDSFEIGDLNQQLESCQDKVPEILSYIDCKNILWDNGTGISLGELKDDVVKSYCFEEAWIRLIENMIVYCNMDDGKCYELRK